VYHLLSINIYKYSQLKELYKKAGAEKKLMQILNLHQLFFSAL